MVLFEASIDKEWEDFTKSSDFTESHEISHEMIRQNLENPIKEFISGKKQDLFALWGPYGQGKTQLMFHLFKYTWRNGGIALFTKLEKLLPKGEMKGSDQFKEYIENLIKNSIIKIKNGEIDEVDLLNSECRDWLKLWINSNPLHQNIDNRAVLLIDEMEENYRALLDRVKAEENAPLKACTAQDNFMIIAAFAPTSQYEALTGEAEKRRWKSYRLPTLTARVLKDRNMKYGNFAWWVSKGRLGLAFKILDVLQNRPLNVFSDFEEFADKDIGKIAKVSSIETSEFAKYMDIKDYLTELFPHSEIKHEVGLTTGKIIREIEFINTLKNGLKEEGWEAREIEILGDYLNYIINALSIDEGFLFPQEKDGKDPERILTLLKIGVDFAIEITGRNDNIISIYDKIYKWKNFEGFYYTKLFSRVLSLSSKEGSVLSYDLLPKLFPLPITSPIIGEIPIEQCRENILTNHPSTNYYLAKDIATLYEGQIYYLYFINNKKLNQFLNSTAIKEFLPPDKGIVCIVLEDKEEIRLDSTASWLKTQNRLRIEYPSRSLIHFLISFMNHYQQSFEDGDLKYILSEKAEEEFKKDKTLSRKLYFHADILEEFLKFNANLSLKRDKFEIKNKDNVNTYRTRYDRFSDVVGLSFCKIDELDIIHRFKQIIMGSNDLKELRTGVSGLLKDVSISKPEKKPLKLSGTLETVKDFYGSELNNLIVLANLSDEADFIKLSSEDNSKELLKGIYKYIKPPHHDKSLITQEINTVIESIANLKAGREAVTETFGSFLIKESKSESISGEWNAILTLLGHLNGGYPEYLVCNFSNAILDKFKDDILSNDQNLLTKWQKNTLDAEEYKTNLAQIDNLEYTPKWLNIDKNELKNDIQKRYSEATRSLTNFQDEVNFDAIDNLNWDSFNQELEKIKTELEQIRIIEGVLKEIVMVANKINITFGGEP